MSQQTKPRRKQVDEEEIATALHAVRLSEPRICDLAAVVGDGPLAFAMVAVLQARGLSNVTLIANEGEWARSAARAGASVFSPPASAEGLDQIRASLGGYGPDFVFACDGLSEACRLAIEVARPAGTVVLMAQDAQTTSMNPNLLVFPDKRVKGSGGPTDEDREIARNFVKDGRLAM